MVNNLDFLFNEFKNGHIKLYFIAKKVKSDNEDEYSFLLVKIENNLKGIPVWEHEKNASNALVNLDVDKELYKVYAISNVEFDKFMKKFPPEERNKIRIKFAK